MAFHVFLPRQELEIKAHLQSQPPLQGGWVEWRYFHKQLGYKEQVWDWFRDQPTSGWLQAYVVESPSMLRSAKHYAHKHEAAPVKVQEDCVSTRWLLAHLITVMSSVKPKSQPFVPRARSVLRSIFVQW